VSCEELKPLTVMEGGSVEDSFAFFVGLDMNTRYENVTDSMAYGFDVRDSVIYRLEMQ